jgi:probable F420-dependent oxidoreductase
MSVTVRAAISMPQRFADGTFDPQSFRAYLRRAEALGFESAWTQEQVLGRFPQLGPTETMTFAAACTEHIRLGCAVYVTPLHNPVLLAKSLSTLDQLSVGRLEVGVGAGGKRRPFAAFGVDAATYIARFTEGVALMKACWTEPTITFDGRFWQMHDAEMEPKPMQKPFPPLWFGGGHENALRRAVRLGSGFFGAGSTTTAQFREQVRDLRRILAEERRDGAEFPIAKRVYIHVDEDDARAARVVSENLAQIYAHIAADFSAVAVFGSPKTCIDGVREVVEAGAELILFTPLHDGAAQMERVAAEVVPAF